MGYVALDPFVVAPGDTVRLTDVTAGTFREVVASGRPALDSGVACGAAVFAGARDEGSTVTVGALSAGEALTAPQVFGAGDRFSGSFAKPLASGAVITVQEGLPVDDGSTAGLTVFSTVKVTAAACPAAPPSSAPAPAPVVAPAPAKDVLPPSATLTVASSLLKASAAYRALVRGRFADRVAVSEPGAVRQTLYVDDGAPLPKATAAAVKRRVPTVLGAGAAKTARPGAVAVTIKLSKMGARRLKRSRGTRVALVTTVTDAAGNARVLAPKRFMVKRTK
jgi:hypothetical protein